MVITTRRTSTMLAIAAWLLLVASPSRAGEIRVMTSGAFTEALVKLIPRFEQTTPHSVQPIFGASMGAGATTIPSRLARGEVADVVILAASALDDLIARGLVVKGSRVDLVRSRIGLAVRAGAPKPDISSVEALRATLLAAKSIGYSSSASGVYLSTELFPRLGIAAQMIGKSRVSEGAVGPLVANGEAEIGFQQMSELLPVPGIDIVGPLPEGAQRVTIFSAGIPVGAPSPENGRALIRFITSPAAAAVVKASGLEPIAGPP